LEIKNLRSTNTNETYAVYFIKKIILNEILIFVLAYNFWLKRVYFLAQSKFNDESIRGMEGDVTPGTNKRLSVNSSNIFELTHRSNKNSENTLAPNCNNSAEFHMGEPSKRISTKQPSIE